MNYLAAFQDRYAKNPARELRFLALSARVPHPLRDRDWRSIPHAFTKGKTLQEAYKEGINRMGQRPRQMIYLGTAIHRS